MPDPLSQTSISPSPPEARRTATSLAPESSAFSISSLSALAGRSTTSPAAIRLISSGGRRLIDMPRVLAQSIDASAALFFPEDSTAVYATGLALNSRKHKRHVLES